MTTETPARAAQILCAARSLFSEHGYTGTSLSMITERVGCSRRDLYAHFGGKEGILRAVIRHTLDEVLGCTAILEQAGGRPPRAVLAEFGTAFLARMLDPAIVATFQVFATAKIEHPEIGREAFDHGPAMLYRAMARYLAAETAAGRLAAADPDRAAIGIVEAFKGDFQLRRMMGAADTFAPAELEAHVRGVVDMLLAGLEP